MYQLHTALWKKVIKTITPVILVIAITFSFSSNSLESKLAKKLDDIDRARLLISFYAKITKTLSTEDQHLFQNWLVKYCLFLSNAASKETRLLEELNSEAFQVAGFKEQILEFLKGLDEPLPLQEGAKRVAILYTGSGGGGHKAPAMAMREKLILEGYTVETIDIDEVEKKFEPTIFGRGYEDIWTEFYQQRNLPTLARWMWELHHLLYRSEWRKTNQVVRNKLKAFNPSLIFSVADHKPQLASLAYILNRKMIIVHTDNKFSSKLTEIARIQTIFKNTFVQFTKPTIEVSANYKKNLPDIAGVKEQIIDLQIPVRQGFKPITLSQQNEIKKELGLNAEVKVCLIMMGNNGIDTEIRSILSKIYEERLEMNERLHLIFVCGRNQALADELSSFKKFEASNISMEVHGFLDGPQMVKVAQAADVWITKMGGSTSSEALAARKQTLAVSIPSHPWEDKNALLTQKYNLSTPFNKNQKVLPQIKTACQRPRPTCDIPDWEKQFMEILSNNRS